MRKKKTYKKTGVMLFAIIFMICNLCIPVRYANAAEKEVTPTIKNAQATTQTLKKAKLNETKATVILGNTLTLKVENLDNSEVSSIKWKANRTSIAKVNQKGVVTPVKAGTTTIKCIITYKDKTEQALSCTVTVKNRVKATKITITNPNVSLKLGDTLALKAEISPAKTTDHVYWFSSDKTVATVGLTSGKLTTKKAGTVMITAKVGKDKTDANTNKVVAEVKIVVEDKKEIKVTDESFFQWSKNEDGLEIIGYKDGLPEDVVIPEKINGITVTGIAYQAFSNCLNLNSVSIPEGVTKIGGVAFSGCEWLESITIPESVTEIGHSAFAYCRRLKEIKLPDGVTEINHHTFNGCSDLDNVLIPKSVTEIGSSAFANCSNLKQITISEGVTTIWYSAFRSCSNLEEIIIPESVTEIMGAAFSYCNNLKKVIIPKTTIEISDVAFNGVETEQLKIYGEKDSYAQKYAEKLGITFITE